MIRFIMEQLVKLFRDSTGKGLKYLFFLPPGAEKYSTRKWPVILFLHGAGERGDDPGILLRHGIPRLVETRSGFPFITLSPQCPARFSWTSQLDSVHSLLISVLKAYPCDVHRVYLTGISMGGNGAWTLGAFYPTHFAAVAPICGYGLARHGFPQKVCALKDVPIWTFHGKSDPIIPVEESRILVETLRACGGRVRFTVYPGVGHDSWTRTYDNPHLYRWFLSHSLSA